MYLHYLLIMVTALILPSHLLNILHSYKKNSKTFLNVNNGLIVKENTIENKTKKFFIEDEHL